jgi:hypothetical protein
VSDAVLEFMAAAEQRAARRRTRGAHHEVFEADALASDAVHVGRLEDRIAMRGNIAVALIVGEEEDDVGLLAGDGSFGTGRGDREQCGNHDHQESE